LKFYQLSALRQASPVWEENGMTLCENMGLWESRRWFYIVRLELIASSLLSLRLVIHALLDHDYCESSSWVF
jgi:hypothetical protein